MPDKFIKEILIIEDDQYMSENISEILEFENFKVVQTNNGNDGIKLAKENIPSLILCDITMSSMSGYEVLQDLKKDYTTALIPFVFLTAKAEMKEIRKGMELGADDYLIKPFTREELLSVINVRLEKSNLNLARINELQKSIRNSLPHEMRTPLTSIMGFAEIIHRYFDSMKREEIINFAGYIYEASVSLNHLIEKFLLVSELDLVLNNLSELNKLRKSVMLNPSLTAQKIIFKKAAENDRLEDINIPVYDDASITVNDVYFKIALEEIFDNAFRFSTKGENITFFTKISNGLFLLQISNTGTNISTEEVLHITQFKQLNRSDEQKQGGGLGLAITKKVMQIFNGFFNIWVENKVFNVELKFRIHQDDKNTIN